MAHFVEAYSKPCQHTWEDQESFCRDDIKGRGVLLEEVGEASNCQVLRSPNKERGDTAGFVTQKYKSGCNIVMPNFVCHLG